MDKKLIVHAAKIKAAIRVILTSLLLLQLLDPPDLTGTEHAISITRQVAEGPWATSGPSWLIDGNDG